MFKHAKPLPIYLRAIGIALPMVIGLVLFLCKVGGELERLSYDLPFLFRSTLSTKEIALVYLDDESARMLHQSTTDPWDRSLHVKLLDRLTRDGAKAVYYDIVFVTRGPKPEVDQQFADAMRRNGHVILGADYSAVIENNTPQMAVIRPYGLFEDAAAGWGLAIFRHVDPDFGVRRLYCGTEDVPTASWVAATLINPAGTDPKDRLKDRWLNYYGKAGTFSSTSFDRALTDDIPPEFFRGKIVVIGRSSAPGGIDAQRDDFANPWTRFGDRFSPGVDVHATELLNLLRHDWLNRLNFGVELGVICLIGLAVGVIATSLPPNLGAGIMGAIEVVVIGTAVGMMLLGRVWFDWGIPAMVQIPMAIVWAYSTQYFLEARKRAALRNAFSFYLSPQMADKIAASDFDLKPGGKLVEASIMFTDCKGFTAMSEELNDPVKISETLVAYFTKTSKCILDRDGTIIKYIGDAVMASWGAPVEDADHEYKAALAAWEISEVSKLVVHGRVLTTRVGVSSGVVLSGNLGSPYRFDYTCTGDAVNFASRLERLNKMVGTSVLVSDTIQKKIAGRFVTRMAGHFAVAGKVHGLAIHELICPIEKAGEEQKWITIFDQAINCIKRGEFAEANKALRETVWARGGTDGPSEFYIKRMAELEKEGKLQEWTGVVKMSEK
jgi:adenylate cyclase